MKTIGVNEELPDGDVLCIKDYVSTYKNRQFTKGKVYKAINIKKGNDRLDVKQDDSGNANGWLKYNFIYLRSSYNKEILELLYK